ncbi:hypothetical protein [Derxia gummosa]|uniref:Uncharacterized protein n=1 Tax=Derxia gummosa DSM 723 TaxID=1121388 RepID=A0A8B6X1J7_9BURK|nr:hypothetical protein [Derxia gummosa]
MHIVHSRLLSILAASAAIATTFHAAPAAAVESTRPAIGIWDTRQPNAQGVFGGVRVTPAANQTDAEMQASANGCALGTVDANGFVTATRKRRIVIRNGDGTTEGSYDLAVTSLAFPAYGGAAASGTSYFREDNVQVYPSSSCGSFPYERRQGGGIATLGDGTKVRVFGLGTVGRYVRNSASTNIGRYAFWVFNVGGGKRAGYPKTWLSYDPGTGFNVDPSVSGVADFLGGDGVDELRVGLYKDFSASAAHPNGYRLWRFSFYNLADGSVIKSVDTVVNNP